MKVYGDMIMNVDETGDLVSRTTNFGFTLRPDFPANPKVGTLVFKDKKLYIYAEVIPTLFLWLPLTCELFWYEASFTNINPWIANHGLDTKQMLVQVYDEQNNQIFSDAIDNSVLGRTTVRFASNATGRIFIVQRLANVDMESLYIGSNQGQDGSYIVDQTGTHFLAN